MRISDWSSDVCSSDLFAGLVLGIWPNIVPPSLSIWDAASPPSSQGFLLVGIAVLLPAILGYTSWSYSLFRGKRAADSGYHGLGRCGGMGDGDSGFKNRSETLRDRVSSHE